MIFYDGLIFMFDILYSFFEKLKNVSNLNHFYASSTQSNAQTLVVMISTTNKLGNIHMQIRRDVI